MTPKPLHFIIVAGEASGDMHAAHLVRAVHARRPDAAFSGLGGEKMAAAGVRLYADLARMAVVGFVEVIRHYPKIRRIFYRVLGEIRRTRPDAVILVDYPGFNLRLARAVKELGVPVIYYISPQVWAWKEKRVNLIRAYTDRMLVLFPFEKTFYQKHAMDVSLVGHPLIDTVRVKEPAPVFRKNHGLPAEGTLIGLLPGSRNNEINRLLPVMLQAAARLSESPAPVQFLLFQASTIDRTVLLDHLKIYRLPVTIIDQDIYDGINACDLCLVASGTATLETAILTTPMIIIYKTAWLTWLLARLFVKIPFIGLVNVVAGKKIVPEFLQRQATPMRVSAEAARLLACPEELARIKAALGQVKALLGEPGASQRAAAEILAAVNG